MNSRFLFQDYIYLNRFSATLYAILTNVLMGILQDFQVQSFFYKIIPCFYQKHPNYTWFINNKTITHKLVLEGGGMDILSLNRGRPSQRPRG